MGDFAARALPACEARAPLPDPPPSGGGDPVAGRPRFCGRRIFGWQRPQLLRGRLRAGLPQTGQFEGVSASR